LGLEVHVLTGDHAARAAALAEVLGVGVTGELLPIEKVEIVRQARERYGDVAMVGDGINDAPALAAADVGVALGSGADVAREAADVCLLGDNLARLPETIELARRTVRIVRQNLFWALAYNVVGMYLACAGWLNPIWASAAMAVSGLLVVGNSLRLAEGAAADAQPNKEAAADVQAEKLVGVA
jgi:P-type E1-E2 ATPase